jgi:glycosyltransferase involved in cell wall biosynthesis
MRVGAGEPVRILAFIEAATVTGPAKNLIEFCRTVRGRGEVEIAIATFVRGTEPSAFADAVRAASIPLHVIAERSAFDRQVLGRICTLVAEQQPDIVQTHAVKSHFLVYLSGEWKRRRWVAFHHGYTTTDAKMRLYNQLDRVSLRAPDRLVTVSQAFARQLRSQGVAASKITVVHNAVDPGWAERVRTADRAGTRRQLGIEPDEAIIVTIGRMSREKAHIDLVRAFHQLRVSGRRARLILVGDGPERTHLEQEAGDGIIFTGQVRDTTMYYAAADLMALPSLTEGSPNALLEAMAVDVPVVATEVGGIPEIVRDGESAVLVPPRDPLLLAAAMERVLADASLQASLKRHARTAIEGRHTPEGRARIVVDIYNEVLADESGVRRARRTDVVLG